MNLTRAVAWMVLAALLTAGPALAQDQVGDPDWRPHVASPAYATAGPMILVDQGHGSVQTIEGRYAGFAALMRADGYRVVSGGDRLDAPGALNGVAVLVISNPARPEDGARASAFDNAEIEAVSRWVEQGGALLLAADHAPHGAAAQALAARFGVSMGAGYAFQLVGGDVTANLIFPREALGDHPITEGRSQDERLNTVKSFTGQSLAGPTGATVLLAMSADAREAKDLETLQAIRRRLRAGEDPAAVLAELSRPASPAQGLAFAFGAGRVVVLGEAGLLTAQIVRFPDQPGRQPIRMGLNTPGHDDQQFALNLMHWLSRLLP